MDPPWPQKVLFISAPFFPTLGGVQSIVMGLADELAGRGHQVTVLTQQPSESIDAFSYRVIRRPSLMRTWSEFNRNEAIIQFGDGIRLGWPLLLRRFHTLTVHQVWQMAEEVESPIRRRLRRRIVRRSVNVCPSKAMAARLGHKSEIIGNPYDDKLFRIHPDVPRDRDIIFVGRLIRDKGADLLIESLALLTKRGFALSATIVGDGPESEHLKAQAAQCGLQRQIRFDGESVGEDLVRLMNEHRVLVVPSRWEEPFGIVALEGMACGCTVVASDGGGLPDAVGACGILFKNGNAESLVTGLSKALNEDSVHAKLSPKIEVHLREFGQRTVTDRYLDLLRRHFSSIE